MMNFNQRNHTNRQNAQRTDQSATHIYSKVLHIYIDKSEIQKRIDATADLLLSQQFISKRGHHKRIYNRVNNHSSWNK